MKIGFLTIQGVKVDKKKAKATMRKVETIGIGALSYLTGASAKASSVLDNLVKKGEAVQEKRAAEIKKCCYCTKDGKVRADVGGDALCNACYGRIKVLLAKKKHA